MRVNNDELKQAIIERIPKLGRSWTELVAAAASKLAETSFVCREWWECFDHDKAVLHKSQ